MNPYIESAHKKLWKISTVLSFLKVKEKLSVARAEKKVKLMDSSYSNTYSGIKDKTLFMLKKQLNPLMINFIKEENWNTDIINQREAFNLMG